MQWQKQKKRVKRRSKINQGLANLAGPLRVTCEVCGTADVLHGITEADEDWASPKTQGHYSRTIGACCLEWIAGRDMLVIHVLKEAGRKLEDVDHDRLKRRISRLGVMPGESEDEQLIYWARSLGIESRWLEARR